ncbi:type I restriction enzyme, S subunit [Methanobrevibacter millerae]|uniref:Type I restriction enzyme, S subunit n=2 Tax=Methanobrevibacter millerae TaxID=230361 RepID=A0A1G5XUP2_9EURY|nr:type I restriction enzyme, S subunit [Methanobrevibacter millerae]
MYKDYFESFELENIPNDWEILNMESIINIYNGYSYKGNELQESNCAMVTIKNFNRDGSFRNDGFKEIVYSNKIKEYHFINENDVLISCTDVTQDADIIGNCIILLDKQNYNELIMSMDLVKIESTIPEINNFLLTTIFKSYSFKKHILGYVNGTTVLHLDKKGIKKFKIGLPKNLSEIKNISEIFEIIYKEIQCNHKEINKLVNLRDTLLPKLMSGKINVSEINI